MISSIESDMVVAFMKDVLTAAVDASGARRGEVLSAIIEAIDRHNPGTRHWWGQNEVARPLMDLQAEYNKAVKR